MKTIGVLAQKGGVGKTTLTLHWAVETQEHRQTAAIVDTDTQGSAAAWGERRTAETPLVLKANESELAEVLQACRRNGLGFVWIDTMPRIERPSLEAARHSDLVIVPCGPSILDIEAIGPTLEIARHARTPTVIVLNNGRAGSGINEKAISVLSQYGLPVCPVPIIRRAALADAFTDGRAVREIQPHGKAAEEISNSWSWILTQLRTTSRKETQTHAKAR